jgi:hypothetical protein
MKRKIIARNIIAMNILAKNIIVMNIMKFNMKREAGQSIVSYERKKAKKIEKIQYRE